MFVRKGFHKKEILVLLFIVMTAITAHAGNGCVENGPTTNYVCVSNAYLYMSTISVFNVAGTIYASATTSSKSGVANECLKYKCQRTKIVPVPVTVSTISGYSVTGPHVSSGGGLQVSFPAPASGSGTITMWVTGTVDRCSVQPGHISRSASYPPPPTVPTLETETVATAPADRTRKTVGVGEEVTLTLQPSIISPVTWSITGDGTLSGTNGNPVTFTAHDRASTNTITASYDGNSCSVTFTVIEPTGVQFTKLGGDRHKNGWTSAGFQANVAILPTTVSFGRIEVIEDTCPPTSFSGGWDAVGNHKRWASFLGITDDNKADGWIDNVHSEWQGVHPGGYTWAIPWHYRVEGTVSEHDFDTLNHVFSANAAGTATHSKAGVSTAPILVTAPTDWPW